MFWLVSISHMLGDKIKWDVDESSALKKGILTHATIRMNPEVIMLSEITHKKTNDDTIPLI